MKLLDLKSWFGGVYIVVLCVGCAHNHGNNYAYAPPYAPPVYPQPAGVAQPVSYAAPVAGGPVIAAPAPVAAGTVVPGQTAPCPQDCPEGAVAVEGGVQTVPCPPGQ